jgi:hypothetical protein
VPGRGYRLVAADQIPAPASAESEADLAASDRRWGFALLLAALASAQFMALVFGGGGHH